LHFKHYISAIKNRLVFAYHLGYQGSFAGNAPFYIQQNISSLFVNQADREGLGGRATVRGVQLNRIVGNGFLWANFAFNWINFIIIIIHILSKFMVKSKCRSLLQHLLVLPLYRAVSLA